jgi:hypothetical protein
MWRGYGMAVSSVRNGVDDVISASRIFLNQPVITFLLAWHVNDDVFRDGT